MYAVGALQLSAGQEAVVHAMHNIFSEENTEAVLLNDGENAFNPINRKVIAS